MLNNPGPRDWTPSASGPGWGGGARGRTTVRESVLSLVLGLLAVGLGLIPFTAQHVSLVFSSVGISAIATGIVALTRLRGAGLAQRFVPMLGVMFGGFGTVLMLLGLLSGHPVVAAQPFGAPVPNGAPFATADASAPPQSLGTQSQPTPWHPTQPLTTPAPSAPAVPSNMMLAQYAGTVVYLLERQHAQFGNYPTAVHPDSTGLVVTASGTVQLPLSSIMRYDAWPDGSGFELHFSQGTAVIAYSTAIGQLEWIAR